MTRTTAKPTLEVRVETAAARALADRQHVAPVDVLVNLGWLNWSAAAGRRARVGGGVGAPALSCPCRRARPRPRGAPGPRARAPAWWCAGAGRAGPAGARAWWSSRRRSALRAARSRRRVEAPAGEVSG